MAKIYGVDVSKKISPIQVRDAILVCFSNAHKEILDEMDKYTEWESKEDRETFRSIEIESIIRQAFTDSKVDFDDSSKEDLLKVLEKLAEYASEFRKPEIIKKHYKQIKELIRKI